MIKREAVKIDKRLLDFLRDLKRSDNRTITWHLEKGISNYLKSKKVAVIGDMRKAGRPRKKNLLFSET